MTLYRIALFFLIYSFGGWVLEVCYQAVSKGLVVNRGFLNGPVCPIYGFGVVGLFMIVNQIRSATSGADMEDMNIAFIFLGGLVFATLVELIGGVLLDKAFHARWWDYSDNRFNFHGYICPGFSIIWGGIIVIVVKFIQPLMGEYIDPAPPDKRLWIVVGIAYVAYLADFIISVAVMVGLNKRLAELDELSGRMRVVSDGLSRRIGAGAIETVQHVENGKAQVQLAKNEFISNVNEKRDEVRDSYENMMAEAAARISDAVQRSERELAGARDGLENLREEIELKTGELYDRIIRNRHFGAGRLLRAFPNVRFREYQELVNGILETIKEDDGRR